MINLTPFEYGATDLGEYLVRLYQHEGRRNFVTFLIGAGFSKSAGIPLAGEIVQELREEAKVHPLLKKAGTCPADVSEYTFLMGKLGSPKERAQRVKSYVNRARDNEGRLKINWSHLLLASMVEKGYVNRLLTTNFDPLIVEALAVTGQPIRTYDLNTTGKYHPGTLDPASVIYLHGQMHSLFLANSQNEMEKLQELYPKVLQEAVQDSLLIVVGYSGECDPVLGALGDLPNFPLGIWWSHYSPSGREPGRGVERIIDRHGSDFHLLAGDDSDSFMRKLVLDGMKLDLPDEVLKPITAIRLALERITPFPRQDETSSDPVLTSLEILRKAEEEVQTGTKSALNKLTKVLSLQMSVLTGKKEVFDALRKDVKPDPASMVSKVTGDGLLRFAVIESEKENWELAYKFLCEAQSFGVTQALQAWLPTILGSALSEQAKLKGAGPESDMLFAEAERHFAEAIRIKPSMHEAFYNAANMCVSQANLRDKSEEADLFFNKAYKNFAEAVRIKSDLHQAYYNWGIALSNHSELKKDKAEADSLLTEAGKMYFEAIRIKPDRADVFCNWGNILAHRAEGKSNMQEADSLFAEAYNKFQEAIRIRPEMHDAFFNWGNALFSQARLKHENANVDTLYEEAGKKFAEAIRIKPDMGNAFDSWAVALSIQAGLANDLSKADMLFAEAARKYAEAVRINPNSCDTLYNWANALFAHAQVKENSEEVDILLAQANEKYEMAVRLDHDSH